MRRGQLNSRGGQAPPPSRRVPLAGPPAIVRPRRRWGLLLAWAFVAVLMWVWWTTASSTANARIAALLTVEPYAFAVHEQLVRNFAVEGEFFQTIHKGYDNAWTWSGHRALTLIAASWMYPLDPTAFGLSRTLLFGTLLGALPAAWLGRRAAGGAAAGLAIGALCYLASPTVMAVALQDYQDLAFATPALVFCWWAMRGRWWWVAPLGTFIGMAPREECIPMAVGIALISVPWRGRRPRWRRWAWNVVAAVGVAGIYVFWAEHFFPVRTSGHDMPLENAVRSLAGVQEAAVFLDGWEFIDTFYVWLAVPFGLLALAAPEALAPALVLLLLHLTVPVGHGVDRAWSGHAHHLAPIAGLVAIATTLGAGRIVRCLSWVRVRGPVVNVVWVVILAAVGLRGYQSMADWQAFPLTARFEAPAFVHPAWRLVAQIPADAVPITSRELSPTLASWRRSYTYDGSLRGKASTQGLSAGTHLLYDSRLTEVDEWASGMKGLSVVGEDGPYRLVTWDSSAGDPGWRKMKSASLRRLPAYLGTFESRDEIPRVAPQEGGQRLSEPAPRLVLPWVDAEALPPPPSGGGGPQQPGSMQPGSMQPGSMQPGSMQPGSMQPGSMQPGGGRPVDAGSVPRGKQPGKAPGTGSGGP